MKIRTLVCAVIAALLAVTLASCGDDYTYLVQGSGGDVLAISVEPMFAINGADWNTYVKGGNISNAADAACDPDTDSACIHAGAIRTFVAAGHASCAGLEAEDFLHSFNWTCDDSSGTATFTGQLDDSAGLTDLLDFDSLSWKKNYVVMLKGGDIVSLSNRVAWWSNPVIANTTGGSLSEPGTVYVVTGDVTTNFEIIANNVSMVGAPGVVLTGSTALYNAISAVAVDHFWIEGLEIDTSAIPSGVRIENSRFSRLKSLEVYGSPNTHGLFAYQSSGLVISDITSHDNFEDGMYLYMVYNSTVSGFTAKNNKRGLRLGDGFNNTLRGLSTDDNSETGVYIVGGYYNSVKQVSANGNIYGLYFYGDYSSELSDLNTSGNVYGLYMYGGANNELRDIYSSGDTSYGIYLNSSNSNTFHNLNADNGYYGVYLMMTVNSKFYNIRATNNDYSGLHIAWMSNKNDFSGIKLYNNGYGAYFQFSADNNRFSDITASNNVFYGIYSVSSNSNTFSRVTAANNDSYGIYLSSSNDYTFAAASAVNNLSIGVMLSSSGDNVFYGLNASDSSYGINLSSSSNNYFGGPLKVGNTGQKNCYVTGGTNPGLVDTTCTESGLTGSSAYGVGNISDALLTNSVTIADSFIGNVTSEDSVNASDSGGTAAYSGILDWLNFENDYRAWGTYSTDAFPGANHQGWCNGGTCQIWDWSLYAADTVLINSSSYPDTGDIANTLTQSWNGAAANQSACDTLVPGSVFVTDHCETTLLRNAVELMDDGVGNDNTLCESDEVCLYTPNMGAYQGHGSLVSAGGFTDGIIANVTLMKYETNGY